MEDNNRGRRSTPVATALEEAPPLEEVDYAAIMRRYFKPEFDRIWNERGYALPKQERLPHGRSSDSDCDPGSPEE